MSQNRTTYLYSVQGGRYASGFFQLYQEVDQYLNEVANHDPENIPTPPHYLDIHTGAEKSLIKNRENARSAYIKAIEEWINKVEKIQKKQHKKNKPTKSKQKHDDNSIELLSADSQVAPAAPPSLDMQAKLIQIKLLLPLIKEQKAKEDLIEVYEMRIRESGVTLDELPYHEEEHAYLPIIKRDTPPDIKIITGGSRINDTDEVVALVNQQEYHALQDLGMTLNQNGALTARLINTIGQYRRTVTKGILRGLHKTDTFLAKESICRALISQLRCLQTVEAVYFSFSAPDIQSAINTYIKQLKTLEHNLAFDGIFAHTKTEKEKKWLTAIRQALQKQITDAIHEAHLLANTIEKTHPISIIEKNTYAFDIEIWLLKQASSIIAFGKLSADLIDVSGKLSPSIGEFYDACAAAAKMACTYVYPKQAIHSLQQGVIKGNKAIFLNSASLVSGETALRDFVFSLACVKSGLLTSEELVSIASEPQIQVVKSRGFARIQAWPTRNKTKKTRDAAIEEKEWQAENLSITERVWKAYDRLRENVQSTNESYKKTAQKIFVSFGHAVQNTAQQSVHESALVLTSIKNNFVDDFSYGEKPKKLIRQQAQIEEAESSPIESSETKYENISECQAWNPATLYSVANNFLQEFGGFFIEQYDSKPLLWTIATLVGGLAGATALSPAGVKAVLLKMGCPESMAMGFVQASEAISVATTKSELFQLIGTATTMQQGLFLVLDSLARGADSLLANAIIELKRNLPIAVLILGSSLLSGWALTQLPMFEADVGSVPNIARFFSGLKVMGLGYEMTVSEPGQRSALANTIGSTVNMIGNIFRAAASFLQTLTLGVALFTRDGVLAKRACYNFARPWLDLTDTGIRFIISSIDFVLQAGTTLFRGLKAVIKAVLESIINLAAKYLPNPAGNAFIIAKSKIGEAFDDTLLRPIKNYTTRSVRSLYTSLDDLYLGNKPKHALQHHGFFRQAYIELPSAPRHAHHIVPAP